MTHLERRISALVIAITAMGAGAAGFDLAAQETDATVLSSAEVRSLVTASANASAERRSALSAFLEKSEVRRIATSVGIDVRGVESAASTLSDEEIGRLEPSLRAANEALAGGAGTVTIATTTIVIAALILVIVLLV